MPLCTLQHTRTQVNTRMLGSPVPHLPDLTMSQGKRKCGSYLVRVSLHAPPAWQAGAFPGGTDPRLRSLRCHTPCLGPDGTRHLCPWPSPNRGFSVHNPNHSAVTAIRGVNTPSYPPTPALWGAVGRMKRGLLSSTCLSRITVVLAKAIFSSTNESRFRDKNIGV